MQFVKEVSILTWWFKDLGWTSASWWKPDKTQQRL